MKSKIKHEPLGIKAVDCLRLDYKDYIEGTITKKELISHLRSHFPTLIIDSWLGFIVRNLVVMAGLMLILSLIKKLTKGVI